MDRALNIRYSAVYIEVRFRLYELEVDICKTSKGIFDCIRHNKNGDTGLRLESSGSESQ
jgi:hypothetical protein